MKDEYARLATAVVVHTLHVFIAQLQPGACILLTCGAHLPPCDTTLLLATQAAAAVQAPGLDCAV